MSNYGIVTNYLFLLQCLPVDYIEDWQVRACIVTDGSDAHLSYGVEGSASRYWFRPAEELFDQKISLGHHPSTTSSQSEEEAK